MRKYNNNNNNNHNNNGSQTENVPVSERRNEMQLNVHTEISMYNCLVGNYAVYKDHEENCKKVSTKLMQCTGYLCHEEI